MIIHTYIHTYILIIHTSATVRARLGIVSQPATSTQTLLRTATNTTFAHPDPLPPNGSDNYYTPMCSKSGYNAHRAQHLPARTVPDPAVSEYKHNEVAFKVIGPPLPGPC